MRKDVSGGGFQNFRKNDEKRRFKRWRGPSSKIRKNDEKSFRRSKVQVQKSKKMMRKDFQEGERSKFKNPKK